MEGKNRRGIVLEKGLDVRYDRSVSISSKRFEYLQVECDCSSRRLRGIFVRPPTKTEPSINTSRVLCASARTRRADCWIITEQGYGDKSKIIFRKIIHGIYIAEHSVENSRAFVVQSMKFTRKMEFSNSDHERSRCGGFRFDFDSCQIVTTNGKHTFLAFLDIVRKVLCNDVTTPISLKELRATQLLAVSVQG